MSRITVEVTHQPEHYSPVCRATIPDTYRARVIGGLPKSMYRAGSIPMLYADGDTEAEAIRCMGDVLASAGLHGAMRIVR